MSMQTTSPRLPHKIDDIILKLDLPSRDTRLQRIVVKKCKHPSLNGIYPVGVKNYQFSSWLKRFFKSAVLIWKSSHLLDQIHGTAS